MKAHKQISAGLFTAFVGVLFVVGSTGIDIYFRRYGIEVPPTHACKTVLGKPGSAGW